MSTLAPNLFQRRFADLMEIGRAQLPALASEWTDYNAHDPGITLMELLAWVSEAQLYSLSRMRRDERAAYAALIGIAAGGTRGATGLIWSDRLDPNSPVSTYVRTAVVPADAVINVAGTPIPTFRPTQKLLWVPGRIRKLESRSRRGATDLTGVNVRGGASFLPFGESAGPRATLAIDYVCNDPAGLFGVDRLAATDALWPIGVLAAPPLVGPAATPTSGATACRSPLTATLVDGDRRFPLRIVEDSSQGFLTTGAIMLDLSSVTTSLEEFTIELRAPRGFARPPRVLRIEPSIIPIRQGRVVTDDLHGAIATPSWSFTLAESGVRYEAGEEPVTVLITDPATQSTATWRRAPSLSDCAPTDTAYEYDTDRRQVTFGNGVNGAIAPDQATVLPRYAVCDAEQGNVARNRRWHVAGFQDVLGVNIDPVSGGASSPSSLDQRRDARARAFAEEALVSADDIVAAALGVPLLEVARAWIHAPLDADPRTGVVRLVVMRARAGTTEPTRSLETARWREAIRRQLAPRMPLGTRLAVVGPVYVPFSLVANVECVRGRDPDTVARSIRTKLGERLALVASPAVPSPRTPGVGLTTRNVISWIRSVPDVSRVTSLRLVDATGAAHDAIVVPRDGCPRWLADESSITVTRPGGGGAR